MSDVDDLLADLLQTLGEGPRTWIEHNHIEGMASLFLYGGIKACGICHGVLDYRTEQHACQGVPTTRRSLQ